MARTTSKDSDSGDTARDADLGQAEVQAKVTEAEEKGYEGYTPDETPNENYSLQTPQDAPTPETTVRDEQARAQREGLAERQARAAE